MSKPFHEEQKFEQRWLWVLILLLAAATLGVFGWGLIEQFVFHRPWGDRPLSDAALVATSCTALLFVGVMIYIFYTLCLVIRLDEAGVYVRFVPFPGTVIRYVDIMECAARTYRPLAEYGGWGIKYGRSGKAYNISGNRGVQLVLRSGKRILLGSQRADELAAAINRRRAGAA